MKRTCKAFSQSLVRRGLARHLHFVVILAMLVGMSTRAQDRNVVTEVDPGISVAVDLDRRFRLDLFAGREKSEELQSSKGIFSAGVSFRAKPLFKGFLDHLDSDKHHVLVVGVGYEYSRGSEADTTSVEHKGMLDATARYEFPRKILMNNRNRFEFRWVDGEYRFRYRNRLIFERPFDIKKREISPYGAAEAYWDQHYDRWSQFRFTGGVQIPLVRRTSLDFFYQRQHCVTCADPHTNIFGATFNVYFRRRR